MAASNLWFVYESEVFVAEVGGHLNGFELDALRHQLAVNPFAGAPISALSPLMSIDFAGATVIYSVNPGRKTIALIQIGAATGKPIEVEATARSRVRELAEMLRKGGYFAAGKQVADWLIEIVKGWF